MKITDLIEPHCTQRILLKHPVIGQVVWDNCEGAGYALHFARGREKNHPLVVDSSVLYDDRWELSSEEDVDVLKPKPICDKDKKYLHRILRILRSYMEENKELPKAISEMTADEYRIAMQVQCLMAGMVSAERDLEMILENDYASLER